MSDDCRADVFNHVDPFLDHLNVTCFTAACHLFLSAATCGVSGSSNGLLLSFLKRIRPSVVRLLKPTSKNELQKLKVEMLDVLLRLDAQVSEQ